MAKPLLIAVLLVQFLVFKTHAAETAPNRPLILAHIEGILLALDSLTETPRYSKEAYENSEQFLRLHDYLDGIQQVVSQLDQLAEKSQGPDLFANKRMKQLIGEIKNVAQDQISELRHQDPDDYSDLEERLQDARKQIQSVVHSLRSFVADLKVSTPVETPISGATPAIKGKVDVLQSVAVLRSLTQELGHLAHFKNDYESYGDSNRGYAEFYTYVSYSNHIASQIARVAGQLPLDPRVSATIESISRQIGNLKKAADRRFLKNANVSEDDEDWGTQLRLFKEKIEPLYNDTLELAEHYESEAMASLSSFDDVLRTLNENPEALSRTTREHLAAFEAERARVESELASLNTRLEQEQKTFTEAQEQAAKAESSLADANARLNAVRAEADFSATALALSRQELENNKIEVLRINGTVPLLEDMVAKVMAGGMEGVTELPAISLLKVKAKISTDRAFLLLQQNFPKQIQDIILHMRAEHQRDFMAAIPGKSGHDFNLTTNISISKPSRTWIRGRLVGDVAISISLSGMGLRHEIRSELIKGALLGMNTKTHTLNDSRLTKFIEDELPKKIAAALKSANPKISEQGDLGDYVTRTCEAALATLRGGNPPPTGGRSGGGVHF